MLARKFEMEIPGAIAGYFPADDAVLKTQVYKLLLAFLVRQGVISFGKAAELVGVDKMTFITDMGLMGIPYFDGDISEVLNDMETIKQTMNSVPQ